VVHLSATFWLRPQPHAQRYAIQDLDQAKRYLADPILGSRLRQDVRLVMGHLVMGHKDNLALEILGSPDDLKFRSCLTLFAQAASNSADRMLFEQALHQFYESPVADHVVTQLKDRGDPWRLNEDAPTAKPSST
jgi:uncharacterized protein (DUF1810 family)